MISILVLFLLGVASSKHFSYISYYDNETTKGPIVTIAQQRRICAELCMSGLGGEPCGNECEDVIPQGVPMRLDVQSDAGQQSVDCTRKAACPVLCANRLGYPLCNCNYTEVRTPFFKVNFYNICAFYCTTYNYTIYGCEQCDSYPKTVPIVAAFSGRSKATYDWNQWCIQMCQAGEGGSACYCDLLPMSLKLS